MKYIEILLVFLFVSGCLFAQSPNEVNKFGQQEGKWSELVNGEGGIVYFADGYYRNGKRIGTWLYRNPDKTPSTEGEYHDGLRCGKWTFYENNPILGKIKTVGYFDENMKYREWITYFEDGKKQSLTTYANHKMNGQFTVWFPDGSLMSDGAYKNDKQIGLWIHKYQNGNKQAEGSFDDGKQVGKWATWYENGKNESVGQYASDGEKTGEWTFWLPEGQMLARGNYVKGQRDGNWQMWDGKGVERKVVYVYGAEKE